MQLVSTLCFLLIARIHARNVGDPTGPSFRGAESVNAGPTEGDQGEDERRGLVEYSCSDVIGWHDSEGPVFSCDWYKFKAHKCASWGLQFENAGHTATTACCACGGGVLSETQVGGGGSSETQPNVVEQLYCRVLQRPADDQEIEEDFLYLKTHTVKDLVRQEILGDEFKSRFIDGKSPETRAHTLYDVLLARPADAGGLAHWTKEIGLIEWEIVVDRILVSGEYKKWFGDNAVPGGGRDECVPL